MASFQHHTQIQGFLQMTYTNTGFPYSIIQKYMGSFTYITQIQGSLFASYTNRGISFLHQTQTQGFLHIPYTNRGVPSHTIHKHMGSFTYHTQIEGSLFRSYTNTGFPSSYHTQIQTYIRGSFIHIINIIHNTYMYRDSFKQNE